MMHRPYGEKNPKNPCMVGGNCKSHDPRAFSEKIMQEKDAYPIYKRSNNCVTISQKKIKLSIFYFQTSIYFLH